MYRLEMNMHIQISKKIDLRDGEELQGFIAEIFKAVDLAPAPEGVQSQAPGEPVRLWLRGIFADHVIAKVAMTERYFKATFNRDKKTGEIALSKWLEVKQTWVPMGAAAKAVEGEANELIAAELGAEVLKQLDTDLVQYDPEGALWSPVIEGSQGIG